MEKKRGQPTLADPLVFSGSPNGDRTRVSGVRGRYPRPLDDGTMKKKGAWSENQVDSWSTTAYSLPFMYLMAGGRGFEPRSMGPEPTVLPLYDPPETF